MIELILAFSKIQDVTLSVLLKKSLMENFIFVQQSWENGVAAKKITATSSVE